MTERGLTRSTRELGPFGESRQPYTEARRFTQRDAPLHTPVYHAAEETLALC